MSESETSAPKKLSLQYGILAVLGIVLGAIGVALLGYSIYITIQKSHAQEIGEFLPTQNLQLVIINNTAIASTSQNEQDFLSSLFHTIVPQNGIIAVYGSENSGIQSIRIQKKEKNARPEPNLFCEESKGYEICAEQKDKEQVMRITGLIYEEAPALSTYPSYQRGIAQIPHKAQVMFFGDTHFISSLIWKHSQFLLEKDLKEGTLALVDAFEEHSHYSFGTLQNGDFSLFIEKKGDYFSHIISKYDISEHFLSPTTDRYFLIKKPKILWDTIFSVFADDDISTEVVTRKIFEKSFSTFFLHVSQQGEVSLDFTKDILPLFEGDILWAENLDGSAIIYSLPKKSISQEVFDKFADTTKKIAQWSIPLKVGYTLKDGTTVYEVFPNTNEIEVEKDIDENGAKVIFTNHESSVVLGTILRDTFLMVSNEKAFLTHFWDLTGGETAFTFPNTKNTFFSFGFRKRPSENTPFEFAHISGEEHPDYFLLSGKITWDPEYDPEKKEEIESPKNVSEENTPKESTNQNKDNDDTGTE